MLNRVIHQRSWLRAVWQGLTVLSLAMAVLVWATVELAIFKERRYAHQDAEETAQNYARLFDEHIARALAEADRTVIYVREQYLASNRHFDLKQWSSQQSALSALTIQLAIIGPDGLLESTTVATAPTTSKMDLSDREHFRVHVASTEDRLFISKPVLGRASNRWTIQLTRRIFLADGSFGGVIVGSLDVYRLSQFYESINIGANGSITVVGTDRIIRAKAGLSAETLGQPLQEPGLFHMATREPVGVFVASADGANQISAYRVIRDYPLIVIVGLSEAEIYASSTRAAVLYRSAAGVVTVILLGVIIMGTRHRLRLAAAMQALVTSRRSEAETARELEVTLNNIAEGIIMVNASHHVAVMNQRVISLLDLPQSFLGSRMDFRDLFKHQRESGEFDGDTALIGEMRALIAADGLCDEPMVYERRRPDGMVLEVRNFPLPGGGFVRTFTDITARKQIETDLAEARDNAESATRAKSAFLATMSHEIRTPLNGIVGMLSVLQQTDLTEEQTRFVNTIGNCGEALLEIITDILDYSKLEAGEIEFETTSADIASVIEAAFDIVAVRLAAKNLHAAVEIAPDVPPVIRSDPARLRQVFLNLLSNAVKFTDHGGITVAVGLVEDRGGDARLRFEVRDTGIGMSASEQERLFKEFMQVDASITRRYGGTGLGLVICKKIVTAMGGAIGVASEAGKGSRFWFELPVQADPAAITGNVVPHKPEVAGMKPMRVLVVEDNAVNREVAGQLLTRMGHSVTVAENGQEATAICADASFDVILMDMQMPVMDGLEATRLIRQSSGHCRDTIIIALTANAFSSDRTACLKAGMNGFIAKPVDRKKLQQALDQARQSEPVVPQESSPSAGLDIAHRSALFDEIGTDAACRLVVAFWREAARLIEAATQAQATGDREQLALHIHTLKGAAMNLGYSDVVNAASSLEVHIRAGNGSMPGGLQKLRDALNDTRAIEPLAGPASATAPQYGSGSAQ